MNVDRLPWGKFVWAHWENDEALALCSMAAQGFWMRLLCIAVKEDGLILVGGKAPTTEKLARIVRASPAEVQAWLDELEAEGVFSRTGDGVIYNRRMAREARSAKKNRENGAKGGNPKLRKDDVNHPPDNPPKQPTSQPLVEAKPENRLSQRREEKEERRGDSSVSDETGAEAPSGLDDLADLRALDLKAGSWRLALKVLMGRGGYPEARARPLVGKWSKAHAPVEVWQACEAAWRCGTLDPVSYITAALERIAEDDSDVFLRPTETRQRLWMQDFAASPRDWRDHERGPPPGEAGCRVIPEIQREFGIEPARPQAVGSAA